MSWQILVHTRELALETDPCNRFAPGACSLISNQFDMREQNSGAKVCSATYFFARNLWCRRGSFAPGACCRSVLRASSPVCHGKLDNENNERIAGLPEHANRSQQKNKLYTLKVTQEFTV